MPDTPSQNVVYLPPAERTDEPADPPQTPPDPLSPGPDPHAPPGSAVPPNHHAYDYQGTVEPQPPAPAAPQPLHLAPQPAPAPVSTLPYAGPPSGPDTRQPLPVEALQPPPTVDDNPFGDFFSDGPSAWLEDDDDDDDVDITQPRVVGTMLAAGAVTMLLAAWAVWIAAMIRGSGGAEAGGFVLMSMLLWIWYLSMPREQQHRFMLRQHERVTSLVDSRVIPIRARTEGQLAMRRERERYRAMRDERTRRTNELGEAAYRAFRTGQLPVALQPQAQRVMVMERQMLLQDLRIHALVDERSGPDGDREPSQDDAAAAAETAGHDPGSVPAAEAPPEGHSPA